MMNKKGFSIIKVILFIILIFVFSLVCYLTYKEIHNKKNITESNTSIRQIEPIEFNPVDYIYSYSLYGYKYSNVMTNSTIGVNALNYESNSNIYALNFENNGSNFVYSYINNSSSSLPTTFTPSIFNSNSLALGKDILISETGDLRSYVFSQFSSTNKSFVISYNCDIPVEYFNFTFYYNFPCDNTTGVSLRFYVMTDVGSLLLPLSGITNQVNSINFRYSSILTSLPSATKVTRFGFGIAQSQNSTNQVYYLPQPLSNSSTYNGVNYYSTNVYQNYYNTLSSDSLQQQLIYLTFNNANYSIEYSQGYEVGYQNGINSNMQVINQLNQNINDLNNSIASMNITINNQQAIIANLQAQLNQQQTNFKDLFFTFADVPIKTVYNVLNFEFFGLNVFRFFTGVITALGAIWLIKKFI